MVSHAQALIAFEALTEDEKTLVKAIKSSIEGAAGVKKKKRKYTRRQKAAEKLEAKIEREATKKTAKPPAKPAKAPARKSAVPALVVRKKKPVDPLEPVGE